MTAIATRGTRLNSVLAFEDLAHKGYSRKTVTVTVEAGMDIGAVLRLSSGKWVWVAAASVATLPADVGVLIEAEKDVPTLAAGDHTLNILFRGQCGVIDKGLQFKDTLTSGQKATVHAALEAKGIAVRVGT